MKRIKSISILALFCFVAISMAGTFTYHGFEKPVQIPYKVIEGVKYTSTDDLEPITQRNFYSSIKRKESISINDKTYVFSPANRFVVVGTRTYDMGRATIVTEDEFLIPTLPLLHIFSDIVGMAIEIDGQDIRLVKKAAVQETEEKTVEVREIESTPEESVHVESETEEPAAKKSWLIMIDPGHGGKDPGAIAADGTYEKTLVMKISKLLAEKLENDNSFECSMTRDDDTFIPLRQRTEMANNNGADLFVSIHCNAARNKDARGTQAFFLAPARSDMARATAALENAAIFLEEDQDSVDDFEFIVADVIQNEFMRESSRLAVLVEEKIADRAGFPARGPAGAGFYVLNGSYMPAVLVECAFLSNVVDAELLKREDIQKKIADGIYKGLQKFIEELPE